MVHYSSEATSKASVPEKTAQAASDQTPRGTLIFSSGTWGAEAVVGTEMEQST